LLLEPSIPPAPQAYHDITPDRKPQLAPSITSNAPTAATSSLPFTRTASRR
jgi:hypothetical protein